MEDSGEVEAEEDSEADAEVEDLEEGAVVEGSVEAAGEEAASEEVVEEEVDSEVAADDEDGFSDDFPRCYFYQLHYHVQRSRPNNNCNHANRRPA